MEVARFYACWDGNGFTQQNWALAILNEEDFEMLIHNLFKGLSCKNDNHLFGLFWTLEKNCISTQNLYYVVNCKGKLACNIAFNFSFICVSNFLNYFGIEAIFSWFFFHIFKYILSYFKTKSLDTQLKVSIF